MQMNKTVEVRKRKKINDVCLGKRGDNSRKNLPREEKKNQNLPKYLFPTSTTVSEPIVKLVGGRGTFELFSIFLTPESFSLALFNRPMAA